MTITRLIEGLPADERLAVQKLCKIRGETPEEFTRFALWKASQAIELRSEDYVTIAVESRNREAAKASKTALVTFTNHRSGRVRMEVHGQLADEITEVAKRKGVTPQAALREVVANFEAGIARR